MLQLPLPSFSRAIAAPKQKKTAFEEDGSGNLGTTFSSNFDLKPTVVHGLIDGFFTKPQRRSRETTLDADKLVLCLFVAVYNVISC